MVSTLMVSDGGFLSWTTSLDRYRVQESAILHSLPGMQPCQLPKVTQYSKTHTLWEHTYVVGRTLHIPLWSYAGMGYSWHLRIAGSPSQYL